MTTVLWWVQTILTVMEITGAYWFVSQVSLERISGYRKWLLLSGAGLLTGLTVYQRTFVMYSRMWLILSILFCSIVTLICYKEKRTLLCVIYAIYFETLYFLDLFLYIGMTIVFRKGDFLVGQFQIGIWRIVVFCITRSIMTVFMILFYKNRASAVYYFKAGRGIWAVVLAAEHISLIMCDSVFYPGLEICALAGWKNILLLSPVLLTLLAFYFLQHKYRVLYEKVKIQKDLYLNQYEMVVNEAKEKDRIYHDFKNHLLIVQNLVDGGETGKAQNYLKMLLNIESEKVEQRVGQPELDYLLQVKISEARQKEIQVEEKYECCLRPVDRESLADWCMLLGNLWDNAIEGCERCEKSRKISFSLRRTGNMAVIQMENSCLPGVTLRQMKTEKADKKIHGIGLKNVEFAVSRHEGTIKQKFKDGVFLTRIIMMI